MRVLLTGGGGFIGSAVLARLKRDGHAVNVVARGQGRAGVAADRVVAVDIARATRPEDWLPHLRGVDAVVNCAGLLQDGPGRSTRGVHVDGTAALFQACETAGVRRVVHVSAIGVDRAPATEFARTKLEGDRALMARDLDWVILRPSVVVGRAAYGGSALLRGLAASPILPVMPQSGPLQIVQLDEVAATVAFFVDPAAPSRVALDVAGPERLTFTEVVLAYRAWLGWKPPFLVPVPGWVADAIYGAGDVIGRLGWRPPARSTVRTEMARGAVGDTTQWRRLTGIVPRSLGNALAAEPASVQERWFARLYLLKPLALAVFACFWIATGVIALGPGWDAGRALLRTGGLAEPLASLAATAGAVTDIAIGAAIAVRRWARLGLWAALLVSVLYLVAGSVLLPHLWVDPLGSLVKVAPAIMLNLVLLAILPDR